MVQIHGSGLDISWFKLQLVYSGSVWLGGYGSDSTSVWFGLVRDDSRSGCSVQSVRVRPGQQSGTVKAGQQTDSSHVGSRLVNSGQLRSNSVNASSVNF
ncbi:hypothetical protein HanIR_Chr09g0440471 [Helianthus annuus]|nr:hypothetical protein HanIR_Chr09g0440471 [Helianthus annuus]